MEQFLQQHIHYAPLVIFALLILAGLFFPVSEDGVIFVTAILSNQFPYMLVPLVVFLYLGIYTSDLICFFLGHFLGFKLINFEPFKKVLSPNKIRKISYFFHRYGTSVIVIFRFIPFGLRNALFFSAGISSMSVKKFALIDFFASVITTVLFFTTYYFVGQTLITLSRQINMLLLASFFVLLYYYYLIKK
jgi:membrane protein DedA with SNARE-associated domain